MKQVAVANEFCPLCAMPHDLTRQNTATEFNQLALTRLSSSFVPQ
jgi:hypothetical protein